MVRGVDGNLLPLEVLSLFQNILDLITSNISPEGPTAGRPDIPNGFQNVVFWNPYFFPSNYSKNSTKIGCHSVPFYRDQNIYRLFVRSTDNY